MMIKSECYACARKFALRKDGRLRKHYATGRQLEFSPDKWICPGSGTKPGTRIKIKNASAYII
jgi:rubredoxin